MIRTSKTDPRAPLTDAELDHVREWCGDDRAIQSALDGCIGMARKLGKPAGELLPRAMFTLLQQAYIAGLTRAEAEIGGALEREAKRAAQALLHEAKQGRSRIAFEIAGIKSAKFEAK